MFTNNLVMFSFRSLTKILVGVASTRGVFEAFPNRDMLNKRVLDRVGLKTEFYKKTSVPLV